MLWKQLSEPFQYEKILHADDLKKASSKKKVRANDMKLTIRKIWKLLILNKGLLFLVVLLVLMSSVLALVGPLLIGKIVDDYIVAKKMSGILSVLFLLVCIYALYSLSLWLQNYLMIGIAQNTVVQLRMRLFTHFHRLPMSFYDRRQHGELMSRVTNDIENVSSTLNSSVIQVLSSTLTIIGTVSVMFYLSPLLSIITFLIVPVMFVGMNWITKRTSQLFQKQQKNLGELNGLIEETLSGQRIVKAFSQEEYVSSLFSEKANKLKETGFWSQTYSGMIPKVMNLLNNVSFAIIAGIGGLLALKGYVTIGTMVIFVEFARQFTRPLNDLANQFNTVLSAVAGAERVFEILDVREEAFDEKNKKELPAIQGNVSFDHVSFSYSEEGSTIHDISFNVKAGETVAFVGPTGAGKTTIINVLSRFYNYNEGQIKIDNQEVRQFTRDSVRRQMAFVLQESFLFQGSIMDNIRYGCLEASDHEVIEAAKIANAHSFIERLPQGYQTMLRNGSSDLSQGQKQLLAIARAVLADPAILILDEATSSIDTITEVRIQQALNRLMKNRTSFVIAHRLNTVRNADQIIVLQEGSVTEIGSHGELMKKKGFYYNLVEASSDQLKEGATN
ncbi:MULTISPECIES: ABC transporter ATP-binding protein [Bacillus]|uniref:ABC transporter ATP-binding protein n=1 Tax=Bacillus TaxID=1386 RepID=UPI0003157F88|nr:MULTISPECIES: ABC transporter ATP-binding protein [Bacillus]